MCAGMGAKLGAATSNPLFGLGLQLFGSVLGSDPNKAEREARYAAQVNQYNRNVIAGQARKALQLSSYKSGVDNITAAAWKGIHQTNVERRQRYAELRQKQLETLVKHYSKIKGIMPTGKGSERIRRVLRTQQGIDFSNLTSRYREFGFDLAAKKSRIWDQARGDMDRIYDQLDMGGVWSPGAKPQKPKGPSLLSRLAPALGILGGYYLNKYNPLGKTLGQLTGGGGKTNQVGRFTTPVNWNPSTIYDKTSQPWMPENYFTSNSGSNFNLPFTTPIRTADIKYGPRAPWSNVSPFESYFQTSITGGVR